MSESFRNQFTKEEKQKAVLDYDNSAAKYFIGSLMCLALFAWSIYLICSVCCKKNKLQQDEIEPNSNREHLSDKTNSNLKKKKNNK